MSGMMIEKTRAAFGHRFSADPLMVFSPGRVNLIGEHTDYNDGFVLPAAIDKGVVIALAANGRADCRVYAAAYNETRSFSLDNIRPGEGWINYVAGVVYHLQRQGHAVQGFDAVLDSDLPVGAGLSSSAALEGAVGFGLNSLFGFGMDRAALALTGQQAEHSFAGVQCGIMDQFANLHGKKDQLLRLDCRDLSYAYFPFPFPDHRIVLCNSMVHHSLASSQYNIRRQQCEAGVALLNERFPEVSHLRDVTPGMLASVQDSMDPLVYRRCRYVVEEIARVLRACDLLEQGDLAGFGSLMYETHEGLSGDYEVSCPELDDLVNAARALPGVAGARMMGGGFGGCTINVVEAEQVGPFSAAIAEAYTSRYGQAPEIYVTSIEDGARVV